VLFRSVLKKTGVEDYEQELQDIVSSIKAAHWARHAQL
jgi:hypothetical protein